MARTNTATTRAPRGTRIVAKAFLSAADKIPQARRDEVVKAALSLIREEIKTGKAKTKTTIPVQKAESVRSPFAPKKGRTKGSKSAPTIAEAPKEVAAKDSRTPKKTGKLPKTEQAAE
jgi:hypothetical protein